MHCESKVRYFYWEFDWFILFLRAIVNIPIQTLIISPWLLFRKMVILQLGLGPSVDLPTCVPNSQSLDLSRWHLTIATHLLDYDIRRCGNVALFFANPKKDDIQIKMPYPYPSPVTFYSSPFHPWNKPDGEINIRLSLLWLNVVLWSKTKYKWRVR